GGGYGAGGTNGGNGAAGGFPGGGGAGATYSGGSRNGGNGANGKVRVTYLYAEIDIRGNATSILNNNTTPSLSDNTDYGSVSIDGGSTMVTYSIHNTGTATLTISGISILGTDASSFAITSSIPTSVAPGAVASFNVT